jgi:glycogen debranching enzyme
MGIEFGREICGDLSTAETREWLVTNGIGGYASGTVAGLLTRRYHGLLVAALNPPLGRTLLLTKLDEVVSYDTRSYPLHTNRWADGSVNPHGYRHIESFILEGTIATWRFACADALLEKRIWMQQGTNTTYVRYTLSRATQPLTLTLKALVNYRDYHGDTQSNGWEMNVESVVHKVSLAEHRGICVIADANAKPLYLFSDCARAIPAHNWHYGFDLAVEQYRGLIDREDHLHAATFVVTLNLGESLTFVASTEPHPNKEYEAIADRTLIEFSRFWNADMGYCYDVLDSPDGDDASLRPNQIFAVSLPGIGSQGYAPLLTPTQQRGVVDTCGRSLLTSSGLRSLAPSHLQYEGHYGGNQLQRDGAYHQGTTWGWLLGSFALAHLQVYGDRTHARQILEPIGHHLWAQGLGTCSEIFDGDAPMTPRGCIAQAWTVAEVLRAWVATE